MRQRSEDKDKGQFILWRWRSMTLLKLNLREMDAPPGAFFPDWGTVPVLTSCLVEV